MAVEVSAVFVKIGASGSITVRVEIDLYDPYPNTSGASSGTLPSYLSSLPLFTNNFHVSLTLRRPREAI